MYRMTEEFARGKVTVTDWSDEEIDRMLDAADKSRATTVITWTREDSGRITGMVCRRQGRWASAIATARDVKRLEPAALTHGLV